MDETVRDTDMVARYGGEEFVIVMPQTPVTGPASSPTGCGSRSSRMLPLTISGGVAAAVDGDGPQTLLSRADAALYSAKAAGRNRIFYHSGLEIRPTVEVESELQSDVQSDMPADFEAEPLPEAADAEITDAQTHEEPIVCDDLAK